MRRRKFIALVGGAAAWPSVAPGQESARVRRVGVLMGVSQAPYPEKVIEAFRAKLNELGWVDGQNLRTETRWAASDVNKAQAFARELVQLTPDLLVAHSTISVAALLRETRTLPIVFFSVSDPIGSGFVASLSNPGGNVTGFLNFEESLGGKWLQLLKDIIPNLTAITTMQHPGTEQSAQYYRRSIETTAPLLGIQTTVALVRNDAEIEAVVAGLARDRSRGLVVVPDTFVAQKVPLLVSLVSRYEVPAIHPYRYFPVGGGLLSYGIDPFEVFQRVPTYVDRILRGARPADLPVQQPTKFELVINLKAAKALGLTIPESILQRADEVIE